MADDWIKMRVDIYRDPKVSIIAMALHDPESPLSQFCDQMNQCDMSVTRNVMRNAAVGALISVWGVARHRGKRVDDDLVLRGACLDVIDDIADMPGFGLAMELSGWVVEDEAGLVFPRFFEEFNVSPDDHSKAKNAERQRRFRDGKRNALRNVTVTLKSNAREEKRREEKEHTHTHTASKSGSESQQSRSRGSETGLGRVPQIAIPENIDPRLKAAWDSWIEYVFWRDGTVNPTAVAAQIASGASRGVEATIEALNRSIERQAKSGPYWTARDNVPKSSRSGGNREGLKSAMEAAIAKMEAVGDEA